MLTSIAIATISCIVFFDIARKNTKKIPKKSPEENQEKEIIPEKSPFQIISALKFAGLLVVIQ